MTIEKELNQILNENLEVLKQADEETAEYINGFTDCMLCVLLLLKNKKDI